MEGKPVKVKELRKAIEHLDEDTNICALWWLQRDFSDVEDDVWNKVCEVFDESDSVGDDATQSILHAIMEFES
jgi:hypothetical protein